MRSIAFIVLRSIQVKDISSGRGLQIPASASIYPVVSAFNKDHSSLCSRLSYILYIIYPSSLAYGSPT